jgi:predicted phosphodiesterase
MAAAKRLFRIQYVSDLHLELYDKLAFPLVLTPAARYLALAGDIGQPHTTLFKSFLEYTSRNWERVFFVAGNHEYYSKRRAKYWKYSKPNTMFEIQKQLTEICAPYKNVHFLHHDSPSVYLPTENIAVIGTTLWTHIPDDFVHEAQTGINDYNLIPIEDGETIHCIKPQDTNKLHAKESAMLESHIDYWGSQNVQVCVITHHMPSYDLISSRYEGSPYNCCFASSQERLMKPHVRAWIYGHTHNSASGVIKKTLCAVNARGYLNEHVPGFSREAWLEFPTTSEESGSHSDDLAAAAAGIRSPLARIGVVDEEIEFM